MEALYYGARILAWVCVAVAWCVVAPFVAARRLADWWIDRRLRKSMGYR